MAMATQNRKKREARGANGRDWPCVEFSRVNVTKPDEVAKFIEWLCGVKGIDTWMDAPEDVIDPESLVETLWSWQGAPRKRMAKLCWQLLVKNRSREYFDQHFTIELGWLTRDAANCARILLPIQKAYSGC